MNMPPMMSSSDAVAVSQMFAAAYKITRPEALDTHQQFGIFSVVGNYGGLPLSKTYDGSSDLPLESRAQVKYSPAVSHPTDGPEVKPVYLSSNSLNARLYDVLSQSNYQPNTPYQ